MWPLPRINNQFIVFNFTADSITCGLIKPAKKERYRLFAYKKIANPHTYLNSPSFYSSGLLQELQSFLHAYNLEHAFAAFAIDEPVITQQLVTFPHAHPDVKDFASLNNIAQVIWQAIYLYPHEEGFFTFYLAAIDRHILFNYHLLALHLNLNLLTITTTFQTTLTLYKYFCGSAFRQVRLGLDMQHSPNKLKNFCTSELLNRMLETYHITDFKCSRELPYVIPLMGLYLTQEDIGWIK